MSQSEVVLTELGAYKASTNLQATRGLIELIDAWGEGLVGTDTWRLLRASGSARVFSEALDCVAYANGLLAVHGRARLRCLGQHWALDELLAVTPTSPGLATRWRASVLGVGLATLSGELVRSIEGWQRARAAASQLASQPMEESPDVWLALVPDWLRFNGHLVSALGVPLGERGEALGVLMVDNLRTRERDGRERESQLGLPWPALDALQSVTRVAQGVTPSSLAAFLSVAASSSLTAFRGLRRAAQHGPRLAVDQGELNLAPHWLAIAKLLSVDVLRAGMASRAAQEASRGGAFRGKFVVFCAANYPATAAAETAMREGGAHTAVFEHGLAADRMHGAAEHTAEHRFVWHEGEAAALSAVGQSASRAGLPLRTVDKPSPDPRRVLLMTSYMHRDHPAWKIQYLNRLHDDFMSIARDLASQLPDQELEFRWRPHPAEPRVQVEKYAARGGLDLSTEVSLQTDLDWAGLVVSVHSSAVVEALLYPVPVYVHLYPELFDTPFTAFLSDHRVFFYAQEVLPRIARTIRQMLDGEDVLEPERSSRAAFWGTPPITLLDGVDAWRRAEPSVARPARS